jgi:hypothetical protein
MPTPDPELDRVRRAFDAAFQRMRAASTVGDHEDELSNLLQHLYKLGELVRKRRGLTKNGLKQFLHDSADPDVRAAGAAMWARTFDTHDTMVVGLVGDLYTDTYGEMLGSWKPLTQTHPDNYGRHDDYAKLLKDRPVLDTARRAFDALAKLL